MNKLYLCTVISAIILSGCGGENSESSNKKDPSKASTIQEKPTSTEQTGTEQTGTEQTGTEQTGTEHINKSNENKPRTDKITQPEPNPPQDKTINIEQTHEDQALMELPLNSSKNEMVSFRVVEGNAIAEGDINLGDYEDLKNKGSIDPLEYPSAYNKPHELNLTDQSSIRASQHSSWGGHQKWINGIVPYTIRSGNFSQQDIDVIKAAFKAIETAANIKFIPAQQQFNQVEVYRGQGCSSEVGMTGGKQYLSLGYGCISKGVIIHEFMHTLGYYHEQSRFDRDQFINIHWENIFDNMDYNFHKLGRETTTQGPYDYSSIMHYEQYAFSRNGRPTITAKSAHTIFGQRRGLSSLDITALQKAYGKPNTSNGHKQINEAPRVKLKYSAIWMWANSSFYMPIEFYDDKDTLANIDFNYSLQRTDTLVDKTPSMIADLYNKNLFYIPIRTLNPHNPSENAINEVMTLRFKDSEGAETVVQLPIYVYNKDYWQVMDSGNGFKFANKQNGHCISTDNGNLKFGDCNNARSGFTLGPTSQLLAAGNQSQCLTAQALKAGASIKLEKCDPTNDNQRFQYEGGKIFAQKAMHLVVNGINGHTLTLELTTEEPLSSQWDFQ